MKRLQQGEYFGSTQRTIIANNLVLTESFFAPFNELPQHYHDNPYLCYVVKGRYNEKSDKTSLECKKNDIIIHASHSEHTNTFDVSPATCFNIEFSHHWFERLNNHGIHFDKTKKVNYPTSSFLLYKAYKEFRDFNSLSPLMIEGLVLEALVHLTRKELKYKPTSNSITKIVSLIKERYDEDISLFYLAKQVNVHPAHLSREFKKQMRCTVGEFQRNIRVNNAIVLLRQSKADISEIALRCGFADQSYFTKIFKRVTGLTPAEYRRKR